MLVAAFEGWNDAAQSASSAVEYLSERWGARPVASLDPERFYDFTVTRPELVHTPERGRHISWPEVTLASAAVREAGRDVVLLSGPEPQLRWRTFTTEIVEAARALGVELVVTLGGMAADVAHTRPVPVTVTTWVEDLGERLGLGPSHYTGPTGIVGVLQQALEQAQVPSCSVWAAVPHYVASSPSPKATLALVERACEVMEVPVISADLAQQAADYEAQVSELVEDDEDLAGYVQRLEQRSLQREAAPNPLHEISPEHLAAEVERFLRDRDQ